MVVVALAISGNIAIARSRPFRLTGQTIYVVILTFVVVLADVRGSTSATGVGRITKAQYANLQEIGIDAGTDAFLSRPVVVHPGVIIVVMTLDRFLPGMARMIPGNIHLVLILYKVYPRLHLSAALAVCLMMSVSFSQRSRLPPSLCEPVFENWPAAGVRDECSNCAGVSLQDSQVNFSGRPAVVRPSTQFDLDAFVNLSCIESVKRDGMFYNDLLKPLDVRASGQLASDINNVPGCIAALNNHHRTFTPIVIGGLRSQMNFDGWSRELSFEPDIELREYLHKGIFSGFDIVDKGAVIKPYERQNYNSVLQGNAHSFIGQLCDELQQSKLVIASGKPACVHAVGAVPKPDGKYRPITDCKRPIGGSMKNYMESTFHTFSYNTVDNVCESMSKRCFMATVDIAAAYRSIAISPDQWKYIRGYILEGEWCRYIHYRHSIVFRPEMCALCVYADL